MQLYNTLTHSKSRFSPLEPEKVKLYTCGPTVYHYYHIGNLRNAIFNDTLRRSLEVVGYDVEHVMNITDVGHLASDADEGEDKLEKGAAREGKTVWEVAQFYTQAFKHDLSQLNVLAAKRIEKATDHIQDQIDMIQVLVDKGFAYQTEQAIYFDVTKNSDYGKLTGQKLVDKEVGARPEVVTDSDKHHPSDFALWFFTVGHFANHRMHWNSPWGDGFPGWHIECSAIIKATLGDTIDIHTGGVDHIGTHHTNEIAQSESANGAQLSRFWLHNEFMLIDGGKMSKSKENFYTLAELVKREFSPLAYRLLCLQAHYRSELNFTWESLQAAQNFLVNLYAWADLQFQAVPGNANPDFASRLRGTIDGMKSALGDDLNTAVALAHLSEFADWMQKAPLPERDLEEFVASLHTIDQMLGLGLQNRQDINEETKQLIRQREIARQKQDYAQSDKLRNQLAAKSVEVSDTANGSRWRRTAI